MSLRRGSVCLSELCDLRIIIVAFPSPTILTVSFEIESAQKSSQVIKIGSTICL